MHPGNTLPERLIYLMIRVPFDLTGTCKSDKSPLETIGIEETVLHDSVWWKSSRATWRLMIQWVTHTQLYVNWHFNYTDCQSTGIHPRTIHATLVIHMQVNSYGAHVILHSRSLRGPYGPTHVTIWPIWHIVLVSVWGNCPASGCQNPIPVWVIWVDPYGPPINHGCKDLWAPYVCGYGTYIEM